MKRIAVGHATVAVPSRQRVPAPPIVGRVVDLLKNDRAVVAHCDGLDGESFVEANTPWRAGTADIGADLRVDRLRPRIGPIPSGHRYITLAYDERRRQIRRVREATRSPIQIPASET